MDASSRARVAAGEEVDLGEVRWHADNRVETGEKVSNAVPELPAELELECADEDSERASRNVVGDSLRETLERAVLFCRQPALDVRPDTDAVEGEREVEILCLESVGRRDHRGKHLFRRGNRLREGLADDRRAPAPEAPHEPVPKNGGQIVWR